MAKGDMSADDIKNLGKGARYTCAYCGKAFQAWMPVSGGLLTKYCSEACKDKAEPPRAASAPSKASSSGGSSSAADAGAAAAAYVIKKAGDAKVENAKADAERAKVDTMKAERDLALQALEIPEDGEELKRVFFSLASQVDFANEHWYSKRVIAKMGGFVTAWKASHSGRPDFAVVLGLLEEEVRKAEAAQATYDKGESRAMWAMILTAVGLAGGGFGFTKYTEWSRQQAATISDTLVGTYERQREDGETVVLTVNPTSIGVGLDGKEEPTFGAATSFATQTSCSNTEKSDSMWRGCLDDGVDSFWNNRDCDGTLELRGTTLSVALTNACQSLSGDWKRR